MKIIWGILAVALTLGVAASPALAGYKITTSLPGTGIIANTDVKNITLADYISKLYLGALALVGFVALGAIIFHGIRYTLSAGNTSVTQDAKDGITQAVTGVVLLMSAYLILRLINPSLVKVGDIQNRLSDPVLVPTVPRSGGANPTQTPQGNVPNTCGGATCNLNTHVCVNNQCIPNSGTQNNAPLSP